MLVHRSERLAPKLRQPYAIVLTIGEYANGLKLHVDELEGHQLLRYWEGIVKLTKSHLRDETDK